MGGLDLCDGRYDTPGHRLYDELDKVFVDDIHNPTFPVSTCFTLNTIVADLRFITLNVLSQHCIIC